MNRCFLENIIFSVDKILPKRMGLNDIFCNRVYRLWIPVHPHSPLRMTKFSPRGEFLTGWEILSYTHLKISKTKKNRLNFWEKKSWKIQKKIVSAIRKIYVNFIGYNTCFWNYQNLHKTTVVYVTYFPKNTKNFSFFLNMDIKWSGLFFHTFR